MNHDHESPHPPPPLLDYRAYLQAILAGDRQHAEAIIADLATAGCSLRAIYLEVMQPALRRVGACWEDGLVSVAEEHMATAIAQSTMARLLDPRTVLPAKGNGLSLIGACLEDERHDLGLRMFCDLTALEGWEVYFLGASVPLLSLIDIVGKFQPQVLAVSVTLKAHVPQLAVLTRGLRAKLPRMPTLIAGGLAFTEHPEMAAEAGVDMVFQDAGQGLDWLHRYRSSLPGP